MRDRQGRKVEKEEEEVGKGRGKRGNWRKMSRLSNTDRTPLT